MKKQEIINLIRYHYENNENGFRDGAIEIARSFDAIGDGQLAEYIMTFIMDGNAYTTQSDHFESDFLREIEIDDLKPLNLPSNIANDITGIIQAVNRNIGMNKFLFEGSPGNGKTEAAKNVAWLLGRRLYAVDFENLIDSKLGQTNKNVATVFSQIHSLLQPNKTVILFDEIDAIALDRINQNDVREMGRVTSGILREFDRLTEENPGIVLIATTNLFSNLDKALVRRFDAVIDFDRYTKEDLIEIAEQFFSSFVKNFHDINKDTRLFKKILRIAPALPYPGELNNIIKKSLAFSDSKIPYDYLRRLYAQLIGNLDQTDLETLHNQGFTVREIEMLKGESKSVVARKLNARSKDE